MHRGPPPWLGVSRLFHRRAKGRNSAAGIALPLRGEDGQKFIVASCVVRLSVPVPVEGEVTRAVVSGAEGGGSQKRSVAATPIAGRTYLVKSACAADATTTTVSYRLLDARPDSDGQSTAERLVMAARFARPNVPASASLLACQHKSLVGRVGLLSLGCWSP
jgi:hypothetical protein